MPLLFVGEIARQIGRYAIRNAYPVARGLAEVERPLFRYAYRGNRMGRIGKAIYRGYKAGTVIGLTGDAILDALLEPSSYVTPTGKERKTRDYMVKSFAGRKRRNYCKPRQSRFGRTGWRY